MDIHATGRVRGRLLAVVLMACLSYGLAVAGGTPVGKIERIQGGAMIQQAGSPGFVPLGEGTFINVQDVIATDAGETSKIMLRGLLPSDTEALLGTHTSLGFAGYEKSGSSLACLLQMGQGIARFIKVLPKTTPPSSFVIFTPTAVIEVVPSDDRADFVIQVLDESRTAVSCLWGKIRVKNINEKLIRAMLLTGCRQAVIERDKEPFLTHASTPVITRLISRTTLPGTVPEISLICDEVPSTPQEPLIDVRGEGATHLPARIRTFVPTEVPKRWRLKNFFLNFSRQK